MKRTILISFLILGSTLTATAETYRWTDDRGVVNFSDDSSSIPRRYRNKVKTLEDITIRNPGIQQELKEQEEKARQEEKNTPKIVQTPDSLPSPAPQPQINQPETSSDNLPPGRTKSQRIKDNIERRETGEKARQSGGEQR